MERMVTLPENVSADGTGGDEERQRPQRDGRLPYVILRSGGNVVNKIRPRDRRGVWVA